MTMIRKQFAAEVKAVDDQAHTVTAIISTPTVDRDNEVVLPSAFAASIPQFLRNAVHLWSHDPKNLENILGRAIDVRIVPQGLQMTFQYAVEANPRAQMAFDLIKSGALSAYSVGFTPVAWVVPSDKEFPEFKGARRVYTEAELWECSLCAVPANPEALVVGRSAPNQNNVPAEGGPPVVNKSATRFRAEAAHMRAIADSVESCKAEEMESMAKDVAECLSDASKRFAKMFPAVHNAEEAPKKPEGGEPDGDEGHEEPDGDESGEPDGDEKPKKPNKSAKSGAVISNRNQEKLRSIHRCVREATSHLEDLAKEAAIDLADDQPAKPANADTTGAEPSDSDKTFSVTITD